MSEQKWADACTKNCVWLFQRRMEMWANEDSPASKYWHTEGVFLTRLEGIDFGFRRPYDHGKYGEDWRLYGVPAYGDMVELLSQAGVNQSYIDEREPKAEKAVQEWQEQLANR